MRQPHLLAVVLVTTVLCTTLLGAIPAHAQLTQIEDFSLQTDRGVIQNRKYRLGHEVALNVGTLPIDPFFKGVAGGLSYAFHFNDFHAVEVGAMYSYSIDSSLTEQLLNNFGVGRASLPGLQFLGYLNYVIKPFYGKFALANRTLLYQEVFFDAGGLVSYWTDQTIRLGPDFGGGMRFFLTPWLSARVDVRHAIVFNKVPVLQKDATIDGVLYLGAGMSASFGG
jgi:outer membrane beta-barrel protein